MVSNPRSRQRMPQQIFVKKENKQMSRIACVIPTYNGKFELERLIASLRLQTATFEIFVVDSSSTDGTRELAEAMVKNVKVIPSAEFNHGGTRQLMVDQNFGYEIYVFLTQDVNLVDKHAIERLVAPFSDRMVGAVCGRQLPHLDATPLAEHARYFNYPSETQVKTLADVPKLGIKTAFMSNSFAAYRGDALRSIGGFPKHVIFAEDMYATAKMLMSGWKVVYAGNALCRHSHNYSIKEEFSRYFDMGVFHGRECWIRENFGGAGGEGIKYIHSELKYLGVQKWYLWPYAFLRNVLKLAGYKLGQSERCLPISVKVMLGMHKRYWIGPFGSVCNRRGHE